MNQPVLAPPEPLTLTPPAAATPVAPAQASGMVPLADDQKQRLLQKVAAFVDVVVDSAVDSPAFQEKVASVHAMGSAEIRSAAAMSNRMLDRPVRTLNAGVLDENSTVGRSLVELRMTVEELDPSRAGDLLAPRRLLGLFPFGNRLKGYFARYQSAQTQINHILQALYNGQDELRKDNAAIEEEKLRLWETMGLLEQYIFLGRELDRAIETRVEQIQRSAPEKARVVREELLFYVRQKVQDLLTQMAVSIQGYLALDMVRKNNLELIKGVDRATTTTISALRTAVMVAQALTNQRLVLEQITALNETTSDLIAGTASLLRQQAAQVHTQAASATVDIDKLKTAFQDIYATMDALSEYKIQALEAMQQTVDTLSTEVDQARQRADKVRRESVTSSVTEGEVSSHPGEATL
ncbi:MAG: toxic anion resistance protein [Magnetococcus sp. WYHC-3]